MQATHRIAITLSLAITIAACACGESSDPMGVPAADAGPTEELLAARAACKTACGAIASARDCTGFDPAQLAEQCRGNCDHELESGLWQCAPQLEDYYVCMAGAEWTCRGGQNPVPTPAGLCESETTAFNDCLRSAP